MPALKKVVDLSSPVPVQVIDTGNVALSVVVMDATPGVAFEIRLGTGGDWLGPIIGVGPYPLTINIGDGLPLEDRNRGVFVRAPTPTPGASVILNVSFGDQSAVGKGITANR